MNSEAEGMTRNEFLSDTPSEYEDMWAGSPTPISAQDGFPATVPTPRQNGTTKGASRPPVHEKVEDMPGLNVVYLDFGWASLDWNADLLQISARHGDDKLSLFVKPEHDFQAEYRAQNANLMALEWNGVHLMKNGVKVSQETLLEPLEACRRLLTWLEPRAPVLIASYQCRMTDCQLLARLLSDLQLLPQFQEIVKGFTNICHILKERLNCKCNRQNYTQKVTGEIEALIPNAKHLQQMLEAGDASMEVLLAHSIDTPSVIEEYTWTEETYARKYTFKPLYYNGVLSKDKTRRLAMGGYEFQDLVAKFQADGYEGVKEIVKLAGLYFIQSLREISNPEDIVEEDIHNICQFLEENHSVGLECQKDI